MQSYIILPQDLQGTNIFLQKFERVRLKILKKAYL